MTPESDSLEQRPTIRFGIMCRSDEFALWEAECIRNLLSIEGVELGLLIVDDTPPPPRPGVLKRLQSLLNPRTFGWRLYQRIVLNRRSASTRLVNIADEVAGVAVMRCTPTQKGKFVQRFRSEDVEEVRRYDLDFILRFGFNILKGEILEAARFGIWSFHHGDPDSYRGLPPGFWEIYRGETVTGTVLQRLTERLDAGIMLHKGFFKTNFASYPRSRDTIFLGAADWPARICRQIMAGLGEQLTTQPSATSAPIYRTPTSLQVLRFLCISTASWIREQWRSLFRTQQWSIGIIDAPVHHVAGLGGGEKQQELIRSAHWLSERKHRFLADPFAVETERGIVIFAEDYDWKSEKGHISSVANADGSDPEVEAIITLPTHLSYPYLLEVDGRLACIPESSQSGEVALFHLDPFSSRWEKSLVLLKDTPVIDPTVFQHQGRWWLFGGLAGDMDNTKLYAWHADELRGPWIAHLANPLKTNVRSSRPAGAPYCYGGQLFRPAQDCSTGYGAGISINLVETLTPEDFAETTVGRIDPDDRGRYGSGLHTLSAAGKRTVIDGSRGAFLWRVSLRALRAKLHRYRR